MIIGITFPRYFVPLPRYYDHRDRSRRPPGGFRSTIFVFGPWNGGYSTMLV